MFLLLLLLSLVRCAIVITWRDGVLLTELTNYSYTISPNYRITNYVIR